MTNAAVPVKRTANFLDLFIFISLDPWTTAAHNRKRCANMEGPRRARSAAYNLVDETHRAAHSLHDRRFRLRSIAPVPRLHHTARDLCESAAVVGAGRIRPV